MPWLLDGNNLARGGSREKVRRAALAVARSEHVRILVFFDGAPPAGGGDSEALGAVEVRYVAHADSAIVAFLRRQRGGWRVATDDRELARLARESGAETVPAGAFWRKAEGAQAPRSDGDAKGAAAAEEAAFFRDPSHRLPDVPGRVPRRRRPDRG